MGETSPRSALAPKPELRNHLRFQHFYQHLRSVFGDDWFALKAESFARFFGTPAFLISQTVVVVTWIVLKVLGVLNFDIYPFILLNLAFSLQAAYAAPLILLAHTRQADRDSASAKADAVHRESLAQESAERLDLIQQHNEQMIELLHQDIALTEATKQLSVQIESLTLDLHRKMAAA